MKKVFALLILLAAMALAAEVIAGDVYVNPYTRKDGTYVPGHYQTRPDGSMLNNYSTRGNTNPYTGERGYVDPYKPRDNSGRNSGGAFSNPYGKRNGW